MPKRTADQDLVAPNRLDVATSNEHPHHALDVDAADGRHLSPGNRLFVRNDRKSLERRRRKLLRPALQDETLHIGRVDARCSGSGSRRQPLPAEAAALGLVGGAKALQSSSTRSIGSSRSSASSPGGTGSVATVSTASIAGLPRLPWPSRGPSFGRGPVGLRTHPR